MSIIFDPTAGNLKKAVIARLDSELEINGSMSEVFFCISEDFEHILFHYATDRGYEKGVDGQWDEAAACSICGSRLLMSCGHDGNPTRTILYGLAAVEFRKSLEKGK